MRFAALPIATVLLFSLSACATQESDAMSEPNPSPPAVATPTPADPAPMEPAPPSRGSCDAGAATTIAMGKAGTDALLEQSRVAANAKVARYIKPGQGITKEYQGDRLNMRVDEANTVVEVTCG